MDKDTIARLRAALDEAKRVGFNTAVSRAQDLTALLSIAERAADVEGMADLIARWIDNPGTTTPMRTTAEAISRYVLGGE